MRFNPILAVLFLAISGAGTAVAQEEEGEESVAFREPLYMSEVDQDMRTPQAVRVGGVVFVSALNGTGETFEEQLRVVYIRLQSILGNFGLSMDDVAQERIYVKEGAALKGLEERRLLVYDEETAPASTLVRVAGFEQSGTLVSIELIAVASPE